MALGTICSGNASKPYNFLECLPPITPQMPRTTPIHRTTAVQKPLTLGAVNVINASTGRTSEIPQRR